MLIEIGRLGVLLRPLLGPADRGCGAVLIILQYLVCGATAVSVWAQCLYDTIS
jgi:hypothetical protein